MFGAPAVIIFIELVLILFVFRLDSPIYYFQKSNSSGIMKYQKALYRSKKEEKDENDQIIEEVS